MLTTNNVYRFGDRTSYTTIHRTTESVPVLRDHEVLIEIRGVTLNYRDLVIAKSAYPGPVKENVVPCSDGAGVVIAVGKAVEDIHIEDRVIVNFDVTNMYGPVLDGGSHFLGGTLDGMLQQYATVPAQAVVKIPEKCNLDFVQLASLVCAGATAWNALFGLIPLRPGQTVLLQGTGGVSIFALQLAKAAGATTIITSSSDEKLQFVKEKFRVDYTINYRKTPNWAAEAKRLTNDKGVDFVVETGGSGTIAQSIEAVVPGGQISIIGFLSRIEQEEMPDVAMLTLGKGCITRGIQIGSKQLTEELVRAVVSQNIQPYIHKTFGFGEGEVQSAFKCLETAGHIVGLRLRVWIDYDFWEVRLSQ